MRIINFALIAIIAVMLCYAQVSIAQVVKPKEVAQEKAAGKLNQTIEKGIDSSINKLERGVRDLFKKKKKESKNDEERADNEATVNKSQNTSAQKLESKTQYDFVPGDQIIYFDDFSQDAIGDFPALWTSNGSGEVKTVNIAPGNWFHMNGEDATYCYLRKIDFPNNFIIEFDIIPDDIFDDGVQFSLFDDYEGNFRELDTDLYPGHAGLHIAMSKDGWETKGYDNIGNKDWIMGKGTKNPLANEVLSHVIIWIQNRRVRIYHLGAKVVDVPTNIYSGVKFTRFRFSVWDMNSFPYISNLKITTASPDTRSKLITEGKLVTYGITFDVNKSNIKPESFATIKSIADVLKENPGVRVRIVGHTDSDGDDALNLALSGRRAEAVKSELVNSFGIDASRLETEGAGEGHPVAPNDSSENKARNRRVEFIKL